MEKIYFRLKLYLFPHKYLKRMYTKESLNTYGLLCTNNKRSFVKKKA